MRKQLAMTCAIISAGFVLGALGSPAGAGLPSYGLVGTFDLPATTGTFDVLPDGRLIVLSAGTIFIQDALNSSSYTNTGSLPAGSIGAFGPSFLSVSPDGSRIAIGDGVFGPSASVLTFETAALNPSIPVTPVVWSAGNFEADWADNDTLYVSGAGSAGSEVREIDLASATNRVVVTNIGGASGGVTIRDGLLYTANGFDFIPGGSETGEVRAFNLAAITPGAMPADFETGGTPVADALSGGSLGFDGLGNLIIGGGDLFSSEPDGGYFAVVDGDAIAAALAGGLLAPDSAEFRATPRLVGDSYFVRFSAATGELLVTYFDNTSFESGATVYRYAIPAPGTAIFCFTGTWLAFASRRRRATTTQAH